MSTLFLPLKKEYFQQIKSGTKPFEYRLRNDYWTRRLSQNYDRIEFMCGYPKSNDAERRINQPWRGFELHTITHPHFGNAPVEVFAIRTCEVTA